MLGLFFAVSIQAKAAKSNSITQACREWFKKAKVASSSCALNCALIKTDMSTFDCSRFCDDLCAELMAPTDADFGFKLSSLYPGLTEAEKKFADQNPKIGAHAYWLSWRAESICKGEYHVSDTNDESDACRHFIWAALLNTQFGAKLTSEILDAHEQNPDQPEEEKSMDLANNRRGLIVSSELIKDKKYDEGIFLKQFLTDLRSGKIVVLKRRKK